MRRNLISNLCRLVSARRTVSSRMRSMIALPPPHSLPALYCVAPPHVAPPLLARTARRYLPSLATASTRSGDTSQSPHVVSSRVSFLVAAAAVVSCAAHALLQRKEAEAQQQKLPQDGQQQQQQQQRAAQSPQEDGEEATRRQREKDEELPRFPLVIIGGGLAAYAAVETILQRRPHSQVLLITDEAQLPYARAMLPSAWTQEETERILLEKISPDSNRGFANYRVVSSLSDATKLFAESTPGQVLVLQNSRVMALSQTSHALVLNSKEALRYQKLLIATGGTPVVPMDVSDTAEEHTSTFHTIADYQYLHRVLHAGASKEIAVVGDTRDAVTLAVALTKAAPSLGIHVRLVLPSDGVLGDELPNYLAAHAADLLQRSGVQIERNRFVTAIEKPSDDAKLVLRCADDSHTAADHAIVVSGCTPNVELARMANLEIDEVNGGIAVNTELAAFTDVYVAGDVASYYDSAMGRVRFTNEVSTRHTAAVAALNMIGELTEVNSIPAYTYCLHEQQLDIVGLVDSELESVSVFPEPSVGTEPFRHGAVYYLKSRKVVGVLLWNLPHRVRSAQSVIKKEYVVRNPQDCQKLIAFETLEQLQADRFPEIPMRDLTGVESAAVADSK